MVLFAIAIIYSPGQSFAEYNNGDCIFANDLPEGAILTGFTVSGNGVSNVSSEAIVVRDGNTPRLVLTNNIGNSVKYTNALTSVTSMVFSISNYITSVSLPLFEDICGDAGDAFYDDGWDPKAAGLNVNIKFSKLIPLDYNSQYWLGEFTPLGFIWIAHESGTLDFDGSSNRNCVRLAFNFKANLVLKYNSGKFSITTNSTDIQNAFTAKYGSLYIETINAKNAANAAKTSADAANSNAWNAWNGLVNGVYSNGKSLSATYDLAASANNYGNWSAGYLDGSKNGGKSLAATYDKASASFGDTTYIRNMQLPGIENKIANLETIVNNINSDTMAPIVKVQTVSGARATSAGSVNAMISVSDNEHGPFEYSINGGSYNNLPVDGVVTLPVSSYGNNMITVRVKDPAGNIGTDTIVIRRL